MIDMSNPHLIGTLVEVFNDDEMAQAAVRELKAVGFTELQIGIVSHDRRDTPEPIDPATEISESAVTGAAAGLGLGTIWGLGVLAGIAPGVGPAIAGGTLGVLLSTAAAGAATMGTAGALIGLGVSHEEAGRYEDMFKSGHTIVTVRAGTRADIASSVLNRFNGSQRYPSQAM